jgi:hypothetical protein
VRSARAKIWFSAAVLGAILAGFFGHSGSRSRSSRLEQHACGANCNSPAPSVIGLKFAPAAVPLMPSLTGVVRDESGQPIHDSRVCASCSFPACGAPGPAAISCTAVGRDGRYSLELPAGRYRVVASAAGYRPGLARGSDDASQTLTIASESLTADMTLERGGEVVSGRVLDVSGGPIAGAWIASVHDRDAVEANAVRSDDEGRFALDLEPGPTTVRASASGYSWTYSTLNAPADNVELVLTPASTLSGIVVNAEDGNPVADVEVRATKLTSLVLSAGDGSALTNAAGRFVIESVSDGSFELTARAPHRFGRAARRLKLGVADHAENVRIELRPAAVVEGFVTLEPSGQRCASGSVLLAAVEAETPGLQLVASAAIEPTGHVVFPAIRQGAYRAEVNCDRYPLRNDYAPIQVGTQDVRELAWSVSAGVRVLGRVVDRGGHGVADRNVHAARVAAGDLLELVVSTQTDATGAFELVGLSAEPYRFEVDPDADAARTVDLSHVAAASSLILTVKTGGTIQVQLEDSHSTILQGLFVSAFGPSGEARAVSAGLGSYELRGVPEGTYEVVVSDARIRLVSQAVEVHDGASTDVRIALPQRSATLRGRVVDDRGEPVADAWVRAATTRDSPSTPDPGAVALSMSDGGFVITNLVNDALYDVEARYDLDQVTALSGVTVDAPIVLALPGRS